MNRRRDVLLTRIIPDMVRVKYPNMKVVYVDDDTYDVIKQSNVCNSQHDTFPIEILDRFMKEYVDLYNELKSIEEIDCISKQTSKECSNKLKLKMETIKIFIATNLFK